MLECLDWDVIFGSVMKTGFFFILMCDGCAFIDMFVVGSCDIGSAHIVFDKMSERKVFP